MDIKTDVEENFVKFIKEAKELGKGIKTEEFDRVIVAGMGGSGISGNVLKIFVKDMSVEIINDYSLPNYANNKTLLFIVTYSGNTEEAISVYNEAMRKNCQTIIITSGGKIKERAMKDKIPYIKIPSGIQPRATLPYQIIPMLNILKIADLDLDNLIQTVKSSKMRQRAKELAEKLMNKIPIIYSSQKMYAVAYRWKTQFNENTKMHAFSNAFSELNHNELEAYNNLKGDYYVIMIQDEADTLRIKKRMELTKKLIMKKGISVTEIAITGKNFFNRVMTEIYLGDLTSIYLAEMYDIDPTPVELIEEFKKEMK